MTARKINPTLTTDQLRRPQRTNSLPALEPGQGRRKIQISPGVDAQDVIRLAEAMPWWPLVVRREPSLVTGVGDRGFWVWTIRAVMP